MGFFSKLAQSVVHVATTPIDVVKDVVTCGGVLTDQDEPYTLRKLKKAEKSLEQAVDDLGDGDFL